MLRDLHHLNPGSDTAPADALLPDSDASTVPTSPPATSTRSRRIDCGAELAPPRRTHAATRPPDHTDGQRDQV